MNPQTTQNIFLNRLKRAKERAQQGQFTKFEEALDRLIVKEQEDLQPSSCTTRSADTNS